MICLYICKICEFLEDATDGCIRVRILQHQLSCLTQSRCSVFVENTWVHEWMSVFLFHSLFRCNMLEVYQDFYSFLSKRDHTKIWMTRVRIDGSEMCHPWKNLKNGQPCLYFKLPRNTWFCFSSRTGTGLEWGHIFISNSSLNIACISFLKQ